MNVSLLIPHYKQGHMTAYTIAQLLKYKGNHNIEIVVVDNNYGDGSCDYIQPFLDQEVVYVAYPTHLLQSHGIGINWLLENGYVTNEWFITLENDAFPIKEGFLDYYENLINEGYDAAVNVLNLSGGTYGHPCGSLYSQSLWKECNDFCKRMPYAYFPNIAMKDAFASHLMVHKSILESFINNPDDYVELAQDYTGLTPMAIMKRATDYKPTVCAFHNGMGGLNESVRTYGQRCPETDVPNILCENKRKMIFRAGYEPGQFLYYWMLANKKNVFNIPIEVKWMPNRENQQQEYSINEAGIKHLWAISSYIERGSEGFEEVYELKRRLPYELYDTLSEHLKIK